MKRTWGPIVLPHCLSTLRLSENDMDANPHSERHCHDLPEIVQVCVHPRATPVLNHHHYIVVITAIIIK